MYMHKRRIMMSRILRSRWTECVIAMIGIAMMGYGIYRGEVEVVFMKAVKICLECIGIG